MKNFLFALPPLPEQRRIVQKVNHLFYQIDALAAGAEHAEGVRRRLRAALLFRLEQAPGRAAAGWAWAQLEEQFGLAIRKVEDVQALRQGILQLAVKGLLVKQDPNEEPASLLLERIKEEKARLVKKGKIRKQKALPAVQEEEKPFEVPEGWVWCRLGEIMHNLQTGPFGSSLPKSEYVENGIPVINPKSIKNEKIAPIPKMAISEKTLKRLISFKLNEGDIIMARRGEMGRCALVTEIESGWLCGTGSLVISLPEEIFKPYFVKFLGSHYVKTYLLNASVGSTMNNLNQRILLNLPVPLPPLAEQRRIVKRVEALLGWCERLEAAIGEKEEKAETLVRAAMK